jgi:hypothetical protein
MSDVTQILSQIESGDPSAAEQLLPLVYRGTAQIGGCQAGEREAGADAPGDGALVHEAYLRLVDVEKGSAVGQSGPLLLPRPPRP